ncbi:MAG: hypothetical protein UY89_C0012G0012 [Parcubacteria group bacterium GW2011_GWA1_54_9]|nr:MAG: hypothetical protein UY89_C0012G0012 [Parcubacteria group bacterium GW2011_GWA1_54_9]
MLYAMSPEALAYPFLFIAIFFESFVLVTLLSAPARAARARGRGAPVGRHHCPLLERGFYDRRDLRVAFRIGLPEGKA